jgi:hypothetical protein
LFAFEFIREQTNTTLYYRTYGLGKVDTTSGSEHTFFYASRKCRVTGVQPIHLVLSSLTKKQNAEERPFTSL